MIGIQDLGLCQCSMSERRGRLADCIVCMVVMKRLQTVLWREGGQFSIRVRAVQLRALQRSGQRTGNGAFFLSQCIATFLARTGKLPVRYFLRKDACRLRSRSRSVRKGIQEIQELSVSPSYSGGGRLFVSCHSWVDSHGRHICFVDFSLLSFRGGRSWVSISLKRLSVGGIVGVSESGS